MKAKAGLSALSIKKARGGKGRMRSPRTFLLPFSSLCYKVSLAGLYLGHF